MKKELLKGILFLCFVITTTFTYSQCISTVSPLNNGIFLNFDGNYLESETIILSFSPFYYSSMSSFSSSFILMIVNNVVAFLELKGNLGVFGYYPATILFDWEVWGYIFVLSLFVVLLFIMELGVWRLLSLVVFFTC